MRIFLRIPTWSCLALGLALSARGQVITANLSFTNSAGTTNGQTITVNGDVRTFTNNVFLPSQILTNSAATGSKTNFLLSVGLDPFSQINIRDQGPTNVNLVGNSGLNLAITLSPGWGTVTYSTQTVGQAWDLRLPISIETGPEQTNIASMLPAALDLSTNFLSDTDTALSLYMSLGQPQTITGNKYLAGTSNFLAHGYLSSPAMTNGQNFGNAFRSPGVGTGAEQFGLGATASSGGATAIGHATTASGTSSTALGDTALATDLNTTALGANTTALKPAATALGEGAVANSTNATSVGAGAVATGVGGTALGQSANVSGSNAVALGWSAVASFDNSTAIGQGSATTAANQVVLGIASGRVDVPGNLNTAGALAITGGSTLAGAQTNSTFSGRTTWPNGADVAYKRFSISSLANGNNADVPVGTNVFCDLSGPSGAFTINGIAGGVDGKMLILLNLTGQNMTVAHDSGVESTAANRIYTMTGADRATTGNGAAMLIYDAFVSRWILFSLDP